MEYVRFEEDGREKLKKIIGMVTKARTNAERRARDKNNQSPDNSAVSSKANIAQEEPDTTVSLSQTSRPIAFI